MSGLLENLNPEQLTAITLPDVHALVLAGAGSGKTRVLTTRIAWLLESGRVRPSQVLAVTFTNKAARAMQARLAAMLAYDLRGLWMGTFHGLCNRLLRAHHREAGLAPLFQILDSADQLSAIKRVLKQANVDETRFPPRELQQFINAQKEAGKRAGAVDAWDARSRTRAELYAEYERQCERESVVDFAELLLRSYELLASNQPLREHYRARFRHLLVDEFQDTNVLQYRWLKMLAGLPGEGGGVLFCVGDDDQSIYRFRGAEVGNMRAFEREYQVGHLIRLEQNYRSDGNILSAANAIIRHNSDRLGKHLWTASGEGEPVRIYEALSDTDEARFVVDEILRRVGEGARRDDIALLYRSNAQSRALEHQLFSAGLPYRVYGGLRFFERQEIKHALAYLRLLANPDDDTAFLRVVNFPARGIGARTLETLQDAARAFQGSLYSSVPHLSGRPGGALAQFVRMIEALRQQTACLPLPEAIETVVTVSGLRAHYEREKEGAERLENLDELVSAAAAFLAGGRDDGAASDSSRPPAAPAGLADFLAHASLEAGDNQAHDGEDAVQLMTVHSAKGLEFDTVFVCGLEEGLFPHENSRHDHDGLQEERRLMYVAVTRARAHLYLSLAQARMLHGQMRYNPRSRFLDEIPAGLVTWLGGGERPRNAFLPAGSVRAAPRAAPAAAPALPGGFAIGQAVRHPRFGSGVIVAAQGSGRDAQIEVQFAQAGSKWLLFSAARLEAI